MNTREPIRNVMTREISSVQVDDNVSAIRRILTARPFHHVPVLRGDKLVGIVSVADLAPLSLSAYVPDQETVDAHLDAAFAIPQIMSMDVETLHPDDTVLRAAELLSEGHFHALPVVEADGRLVGIVTSTDILRFFVASA